MVLGDGLAGMAAAARLAKNGHAVTLIGNGRLGDRWAPADGPAPDLSPTVLSFPAPWRDLFRKSGRPLEEELRRSGLELVPAPPTRHLLADGSVLDLPVGRADQLDAVRRFAGDRAATAWRDLVDGLGDVWQALRFRGVETPLADARTLDPPTLAALWADRAVADLAAALPDRRLGALVAATATEAGSDPARTPALVAAGLFVERTFGRWCLRRPEQPGRPVPLSVLVGLLTDRLALRRVVVRTGALEAVQTDRDGIAGVLLTDGTRLPTRLLVASGGLDAVTSLWARLPLRLTERSARAERRRLGRCRPAPVPASRPGPWPDERAEDRTGGLRSASPLECRAYGPDGGALLRVLHRRPDAEAVVTDHTTAAGDGIGPVGVAWDGLDGWLDRPPTVSAVPGLRLAGPVSRSGSGPDRELLSAALAATADAAR